jgi:SAM-dependent methyltransferase
VLTPAEVQIFIRHHDKLSGRVLEVGCGAGRMLAYLLMVGADAHGVDLAPRMVEFCRRTLPDAKVSIGDAAALPASVEGPFDVVIAPDHLIDVFADDERRRVIADIRGLLAGDGLFIFSTHDLGRLDADPATGEPAPAPASRSALRRLLRASPASVVRTMRDRRETARNRARLGPLAQRHADHAIVNDFPHNYSLLHYYIGRDDQERQLSELGFELVDCLSLDGCSVGPGGIGTTASLYYVARPS